MEIRNALGAKVKIIKSPEIPVIVGRVGRIVQLTEMELDGKVKVRCMVFLDEPVTIPMMSVSMTQGGALGGQGELKTRGPFPSKGLYLEPVVTDSDIPDAFKKGWDSTNTGGV